MKRYLKCYWDCTKWFSWWMCTYGVWIVSILTLVAIHPQDYGLIFPVPTSQGPDR